MGWRKKKKPHELDRPRLRRRQKTSIGGPAYRDLRIPRFRSHQRRKIAITHVVPLL